jgi:hypothetical protein
MILFQVRKYPPIRRSDGEHDIDVDDLLELLSRIGQTCHEPGRRDDPDQGGCYNSPAESA